MRIVGYRMEQKFGVDGVSRLLRDPWRYEEAYTQSEVMDIAGRIDNEAVLLLFHGGTRDWSTDLRSFHLSHLDFYTLFVSTVSTFDEVARLGLQRTHGLDFPLRNHEAWDPHPTAYRRRLSDFLRNAADPERSTPNWELLALPKVPEHLIACYLAALAGRSRDLVRDGWKEAFQDEVECLQRTAGREARSAELTWDDRSDAEKVGGFLSTAYFVDGGR